MFISRLFPKKDRRTLAKPPLTLGQQGELWAQEEYKKRGFVIITANEYNHTGKQRGEIDFIARKKDVLVFVEVKTRNRAVNRFGSGVESVNGIKQRRILRAVKLYLQKNPQLQSLRPQIDVCVLVVSSVDRGLYSVTILENSVEDWN